MTNKAFLECRPFWTMKVAKEKKFVYIVQDHVAKNRFILMHNFLTKKVLHLEWWNVDTLDDLIPFTYIYFDCIINVHHMYRLISHIMGYFPLMIWHLFNILLLLSTEVVTFN